MKTNQKTRRVLIAAPLFGNTTVPAYASTFEGGPAVTFSPQDQLRRAVLACLLFERNFYESGKDIARRIAELVKVVDPEYTKVLALVARTQFNLRHVPLWLIVCLLARRGVKDMDDLIEAVIQRADEPAELVAMYWQDGKRPLAAALKRGLARAVTKFDEYQCAKYAGKGNAVRLRDVIFLTHAKPLMDSQAAMWKRLAADELKAPDTWEVALSAGKDKRETFERLLAERKLGYMALLRNLRNMQQANVSGMLIHAALINGAPHSRALPFRFIAAARACPQFEPWLDEAMQCAMRDLPKLAGVTDLLIDVSGSMDRKLSDKSDLTRLDAACGLAVLLAGVCENVRLWTFSNHLMPVAPRRGMALRDAIVSSQPHSSTMLAAALNLLYQSPMADRTIVITDEQSHDGALAPRGQGYMLDVAGHQNGVGYGQWVWITGFSEAVVHYIAALEGSNDTARIAPPAGADA